MSGPLQGRFLVASICLLSLTLPALASALAIGDRVTASANLNVRAAASPTATLLGTRPLGSFGTILGGPTVSAGSTWWNVKWDNSITGWSVERYLAAATVQATSALSETATTGLVGHWTLDNADIIEGVVYDSSGQNKNGTLVNFTSSPTVGGIFGQALKFNGSTEHVSLPSGSTFLPAGTTKFTISSWVNASDLTTNNNNAGIISATFNTVGQYGGFLTGTATNGFACYANISGVWRGVSTAGSQNINTWYLLTCTYDGSDFRIYLNGLQNNTAHFPGTLAYASAGQSTTLGWNEYVDGIAQHFKGLIDDARIYDRVLSPAEVMQLYNSGVIQGYRVLMPRNGADTSAQKVTVAGVASSTNNPYHFTVNAGATYTVSVPAQKGYAVGYTLCVDRRDCHGQGPTPGRSAAVTIPSGRGHYVDLWWHYRPTLTATPNPCTVTVGSTTCATTLSWGKSSTPVSQLWVSVNGAAQKKVVCKSGLTQKISSIRPSTSYVYKLYHTASCTSSVANVAPNASVTVRGNSASASAARGSQMAAVFDGVAQTFLQLFEATFGGGSR